MKYTGDTEVTFYASLGFVQGNREKTFTFDDLGLTDDILEDMTPNELDDYLGNEHDSWCENFMNCGWDIK